MVKKDQSKASKSKTIKVLSGCGVLYLTIADESGLCIVKTGKSGGCKALSSAVGRLIGLLMRYKVPLEEIAGQLINIKCEACLTPKKEGRITAVSCPDAIGRSLSKGPEP